MCPEALQLANSCYLDNFYLVIEVYKRAIILCALLGFKVGILLVFLKKIS